MTEAQIHSPEKPKFPVRNEQVRLPLSLVDDVYQVVKAMIKDAEAGVVSLDSNHLQTANRTESSLKLARLQELPSVSLPVNELEVAVDGAKAVLDGYSVRHEQHLENKSIPEDPDSFTDRIKKVGASIVAKGMVSVGNMSPSGRSARRLLREVDEPTLEALKTKSEAQSRRKQKKERFFGPNEWSEAQKAIKERRAANQPPVHY